MGKIDIINSIIEYNAVVENSKTLIKEIYLSDQIPWVIGYSGGKDSTATTQLIIESLIEMKSLGIDLNKNVYVITSDTLVDTPMIINTIKFTIDSINELAKKLSIPISSHVVSPKFDQTFWVNIIGRGYPTPNQTFRWCTDRMKIDPANRFINDVIGKHGEAIMVLGVRDGESESRDRVIGNHEVKGKHLMRHSTMANTYVFAPIRKFSVDHVWNYLLSNPSPWGGDNKELYRLYSDSSAECPLVIDQNIKKEAGSCGNSRFGCWVCTVVKEDKSLSGFINSGEDWLRPLLEFRNWLYSIRDDASLRMKRRSNGALYFSPIKQGKNGEIIIPEKGGREKLVITQNHNQWIDHNGEKWNVIEGTNPEKDAKKFIKINNIDLTTGNNPRIIIKTIDGEFMQLGSGPYTFETRKLILQKLLTLQKTLEKEQELIKIEELLEIRKIWISQGDYKDSVKEIYLNVFNKTLPIKSFQETYFDLDDIKNLTILCEENGFDFLTFYELINNSINNLGYYNRKEALKKIQNLLNKEHLLVEGQEQKHDY